MADSHRHRALEFCQHIDQICQHIDQICQHIDRDIPSKFRTDFTRILYTDGLVRVAIRVLRDRIERCGPTPETTELLDELKEFHADVRGVVSATLLGAFHTMVEHEGRTVESDKERRARQRRKQAKERAKSEEECGVKLCRRCPADRPRPAEPNRTLCAQCAASNAALVAASRRRKKERASVVVTDTVTADGPPSSQAAAASELAQVAPLGRSSGDAPLFLSQPSGSPATDPVRPPAGDSSASSQAEPKRVQRDGFAAKFLFPPGKEN